MGVKLFFVAVGLMAIAAMFFFFALGYFAVPRESRRVGYVILWFCLGLAFLGACFYVIAL
ncbi:hypothetical protein [Streptomyces sp. B1I3]|uniref:hypothetical protein n=1 Tax=Streptomyces sp. B1I3 TaxID=3042264 RepID=UPI00277F5FB4|nr:hypothetical protein [Streptomyces sp. B1I3]MDQ0794579.1 putative membrane protein [Streptomyces sp. B1I3]